MSGNFGDDREERQQILLYIQLCTDLPGIRPQGPAQEEDSLYIQKHKVVSSAVCRHWPAEAQESGVIVTLNLSLSIRVNSPFTNELGSRAFPTEVRTTFASEISLRKLVG